MKNKIKLGYVIFASIILIGIILRVWGLEWGLPYYLHPDEGTIVNTAINMAKNNSFEPNVFYRPDHLLIKINTIVYQLFSLLYKEKDLEYIAINNPEVFQHIGRFITASFGVGSIFIGYLIGKKLNSNLKFIIPSIIALFPSFIKNGHYVTPDVPITFFSLLIVYLSMQYIDNPNKKNLSYLAATVAAGITIKYTMAIGCILIAIIVIMKHLKKENGIKTIINQGLLSIIVVVGTIFIISPVLITNIQAVYSAIVNEARTTHLGADKLGYVGNVKYYLIQYLLQTKAILLIPCIYGLFKVIKKYTKYLFPLFFGVIYMLIMSRVALHWERWALPMYTTFIFATAIGIDEICIYIKGELNNCNKYIIYSISCIICMTIGISTILELTQNQLQFILPNTRVISQSYCDEKNINRTNSIYEGYTTLNKTGPGTIFNEFSIEEGKLLVNKSYVEYILLSSNIYDRYYKEADRYNNECNIYNLINEDYELIKSYKPAVLRQSKSAVKSIYYNTKYIKECLDKGFIGDELKFFKVKQDQHKKYNMDEEIEFSAANGKYCNYSKLVKENNDSSVISTTNEVEFQFIINKPPNDLIYKIEMEKADLNTKMNTNVSIFVNNNFYKNINLSIKEVYEMSIPQILIDSEVLRIKFMLEGSDKVIFYRMNLENNTELYE